MREPKDIVDPDCCEICCVVIPKICRQRLIVICKNKHKVCYHCIFEIEVCPFCRENLINIDYEKYACACGIHSRNKCPFKAEWDKNILFDPMLIPTKYMTLNDGNERLINGCRDFRVCKMLYNHLCKDADFNRIYTYINKDSVTCSGAISALKTLYTANNGLYFTAKQVNKLAERVWQSADIWKWGNILVYCCLEYYLLSVTKFNRGMCYYGDMGDVPSSFKKYMRYILYRLGTPIDKIY